MNDELKSTGLAGSQCSPADTASQSTQSTQSTLLALSNSEKLKRFDAMINATFSHVNGRDLLAELHPRHEIDIKRRVDGRETWFEGDWLSNLMEARDGKR